MRDRRALVAADIGDAGLQQRLGDGEDALAAEHLAGAEPELLRLPSANDRSAISAVLALHQRQHAARAARAALDLQRRRDQPRPWAAAGRDWPGSPARNGWRRACSVWPETAGRSRAPDRHRCRPSRCRSQGRHAPRPGIRARRRSGPGVCGPSSSALSERRRPSRFDQPVRSSTQAPSGMRPCLASHASICAGVSRKSGSRRAPRSSSRSRRPGATKRSGGIVSVRLSGGPPGDPVHRRVEMRAGVLAERQIVPVPGRPAIVVARNLGRSSSGGDWPNCGGRPITGVAGPSGWVRSTTRTLPSASAATRATKGFAAIRCPLPTRQIV